MIIYKLTFANGKIYIGQTIKTMEHRLRQHRNSANAGSMLAVHAAWRKYGEPAVEVLGAYPDAAELHAAEIAAIAQFDCLSPRGYNLGLGGETAPSTNPEVAARIAAKAKGRKLSDQHRAAASKRIAAQWEDPDYREKVSAGLKASWTPEMRAAAAQRNRERAEARRAAGWTMPQSQRDAISAAKAAMSPEAKAAMRSKMSAAALGKKKAPRTAETRAKLRENARTKWQDPESRAKRLAAMASARDRKKEVS